jgi:hypothetical protein
MKNHPHRSSITPLAESPRTARRARAGMLAARCTAPYISREALVARHDIVVAQDGIIRMPVVKRSPSK